MPLPAAERAKCYHEKNKNIVRIRDNLYKNVQRRTMEVMNPIKNTEQFKKRVAKAA